MWQPNKSGDCTQLYLSEMFIIVTMKRSLQAVLKRRDEGGGGI